jgi:8-oxo-dGTP pyrophosphatase MutT (NUDIX family)
VRSRRLAEQIARRLTEPPAAILRAEDRAPAGVLVLLFPDPPHGLSTLLTVRTEQVRDHKGQISFPGGVREEADADLLATALRETAEEVGVRTGSVRIIGRLDDCPTLTGYLIRPFVAWIGKRPEVRASPVEIAEVLFVPLGRLQEPGGYAYRSVDTGGWTVASHVFTVGTHVVWGATARILVDLLERVGPLLGARIPKPGA